MAKKFKIFFARLWRNAGKAHRNGEKAQFSLRDCGAIPDKPTGTAMRMAKNRLLNFSCSMPSPKHELYPKSDNDIFSSHMRLKNPPACPRKQLIKRTNRKRDHRKCRDNANDDTFNIFLLNTICTHQPNKFVLNRMCKSF